MNIKELERYIATQCVYETIYQDSEGREILVMTMSDALGMVNTLIDAEREACASIADRQRNNMQFLASNPPQSAAAFDIAVAIRTRGQR